MKSFERKKKTYRYRYPVYNFRGFSKQPFPQANLWTKLITPYTQELFAKCFQTTLGKGHRGL